jgi:hypothetical protein
MPVDQEPTFRVGEGNMLDRLVFRAVYDSLDVFLDGIAVYQRLCELDAGLFEIGAGAGHAVERLAKAAVSPTNVALHG